MTQKKRLFISFMSTILLAAPAGAATWDCTFKPSRGGVTPERVIVQSNASTGKTLVTDPLINNYVGHPLEAIRYSESGSRVTVRWELPSLKTDSGQWIPGIIYNIYIEKASGAARISGRPNGRKYKESSSTGACKLR